MGQYIRKEIYSLEQVLPFIPSAAEVRESSEKKYHVFDGDRIKMTSLRYKTFKFKGSTCVKCGLEGKFFAKERHINQENNTFHFNLYGYDKNGYEIMITKDHIIPKSAGGPDRLSNMQPMCLPDNIEKGHTLEKG